MRRLCLASAECFHVPLERRVYLRLRFENRRLGERYIPIILRQSRCAYASAVSVQAVKSDAMSAKVVAAGAFILSIIFENTFRFIRQSSASSLSDHFENVRHYYPQIASLRLRQLFVKFANFAQNFVYVFDMFVQLSALLACLR